MFHQASSNPFEEESLPRAYYFPSSEKHLSTKQKKTCLSPIKEKDNAKLGQPTSKADEKFLRESNKLSSNVVVPTREDGTMEHELSSGSQFNESWPSTDRNVSSLSQNTPLSSSNTQVGREKETTSNLHEDKLSRPSTLSKYIERFRHGAPSSRQDRHSSESSGKDFWWLTPPSNTSTPKDISDSTTSKFTLTSESSSKMKRNTTGSMSPPRQKYGFKRNQFSRPVREIVEVQDPNTADLLARTNQLLEKSENTLSEVSSSESLPKPPSSWMIERQKRLDNDMKPSKIPVLKRRLAPEEDILYQWRLSRRLEKAQEEVKGSHVKHFTHRAAAALTRARCNAHVPENDHPRYQIDSGKSRKDDVRSSDNTSSRIPGRTLQADKMMEHGPSQVDKIMDRRTNDRSLKDKDRVSDDVDHRENVSCRERNIRTHEMDREIDDRSWRDKDRVSAVHARENVRCRERNYIRNHETDSIREVRLERNVPAVCFIEQEKLPSHVHMMCDIVPCSKQTHLESENVGVDISDLSTSGTTKHVIERSHKNRAEYDSNNSVSDIREGPRTRGSVTTAGCQPRTASNKKGEESETRDQHLLHDKRYLPNTKQPRTVETSGLDNVGKTKTALESGKTDRSELQTEKNLDIENFTMPKNVSAADKLSKLGTESRSQQSKSKVSKVVNTSPSAPNISHERTDSVDSGDQLTDMQSKGDIGTVIGQVISERLFSTMSTSSRRSSLSSTSVSTECGDVEDQQGETVVVVSNECENHVEQKHAAAATDVIPFPNDNILIRLRQQADVYREHLRNIDRILEHLTD